MNRFDHIEVSKCTMEGPRKRLTRRRDPLEDGKRTPPSEGSKCFVTMRGWIAESGLELDPGSEEEVLQVLMCDDDDSLPGVRTALEGVKPGETVQIEMDPDPEIGKEENLSFSHVPPGKKVIYELELLDWEDSETAKPRGLMFFEERIEAANERKKRGNESYKKKNWSDATIHYRIGLSYLPAEYAMQVEGKHLDQLNEIRVPLLVNLSACKMQAEDWNGTIMDTTEALVTGGMNLKALYRRAVARFKLGQTEEAEDDLRRVLEIEPRDPAALKVMREIQQEKDLLSKEQKKHFAGIFAPPSTHREEEVVEPPDVDFDDVPDLVLEEDEKQYLSSTPWYWRMLGY